MACFMAHDQEHGVASVDHVAGTNGTVVGTEGGIVVEKPFGTAATASALVQRGSAGQITLPATDPANTTDAASKGYVDGIVTGHRSPVAVLKIKSDVAQAGAPPAGQAVGDAWVVNTWGVGYNDGDIVELASTGPDVWTVIIPNSGGVVPTGTRAVVHPTPAGSFAGQALAVTQKTTVGWSFTTPHDGDVAAVYGNGSVYENTQFIYDSGTTAWLPLGATPSHNSLSGLQGGTASEYYHFTAARHTELTRYKADVTQGGTSPALPGTWVVGDRGVVITTGGIRRVWSCYVDSTLGLVAVRLT